ncbi:hypothetical protein [Aliikangiella sp. IMCC44359]|uniref:hypothetical protein n=1 Tax=Aliikangiella sp. IMCC44359 TaxID=3459125 RepID=UPI00403A9F2F
MAIDREKAIADLSKIQVKGNEEGLIPAFGVLVNQLPASFWNLFTTKILDAAGEDLYEDASGLLVNAAAECGYHTGWGIINSDEFQSVVGPMIENVPEDILHGAYAVFTAWGWANAEIVELIPNEKMVIKVKGYYEADVKDTYKPNNPFAFMIRGVSSAFMDIAYGDKPYPDGFGKFSCEQVKAIELGDDYGEFVVTKRK